jgi:hypothetical protein
MWGERGKSHTFTPPDEIMVQCPGCRALQSVAVSKGKIELDRKFYQVEGKVYHVCEWEAQPCRIFGPNSFFKLKE